MDSDRTCTEIEQQAIASLKRGNLDGLEVLVRRYYHQAVRAAYLIVHDRPMAEDLVQTIFLNLNEKIGQFDVNRSFRPWFMRSVVNAAINAAVQNEHWISLDVETSEVSQITLAENLIDPGPSPEEAIETEEVRHAVWQALKKLTPNQRAVVILRYYLGLSEAEMAEELNSTKSSIKWWMRAARERLQRLLYLVVSPDLPPSQGLRRSKHLKQERGHE